MSALSGDIYLEDLIFMVEFDSSFISSDSCNNKDKVI